MRSADLLVGCRVGLLTHIAVGGVGRRQYSRSGERRYLHLPTTG